MRNPFEVIASCFVVPHDQRPEPKKKIIPGRVVPFSTRKGKEIECVKEETGTLTGRTINYIGDNGMTYVDLAALNEEYKAKEQFLKP